MCIRDRLKGMDTDEFEMACIDAGAEDVIHDEEGFIILAPYTEFGSLQHKLDELKLEAKSAELKRFPVSYTHLTLPPSDLVQISVVAVSLKNKKKKRQDSSRS